MILEFLIKFTAFVSVQNKILFFNTTQTVLAILKGIYK